MIRYFRAAERGLETPNAKVFWHITIRMLRLCLRGLVSTKIRQSDLIEIDKSFGGRHLFLPTREQEISVADSTETS